MDSLHHLVVEVGIALLSSPSLDSFSKQVRKVLTIKI